jgi:hypothetical protein
MRSRIGAIHVLVLGHTHEHVWSLGVAKRGAIDGAENVSIGIEDVQDIGVLVRGPHFIGECGLLGVCNGEEAAAESGEGGEEPGIPAHGTILLLLWAHENGSQDTE